MSSAMVLKALLQINYRLGIQYHYQSASMKGSISLFTETDYGKGRGVTASIIQYQVGHYLDP